MTEKPKDPGRSYNWRDGDGCWPYNDTWEQWRAGHEQPTNKPPATGLGSLFGFLFGEKQAQEASEKYRQALKNAQEFLAAQEMPATAEEEVRIWGKALGVTSGTSAREIN